MEALELNVGDKLRVKSTNKLYPGKEGIFEFWGGPMRDVAVLCTGREGNSKTIICVGIDDLEIVKEQ